MSKVLFPLPRRYWNHIAVLIVLIVLMFGAIFAAVALTGGRELGEFLPGDWKWFRLFLAVEALLLGAMCFVARRAGTMMKAHTARVRAHYRQFSHRGLEPGEYDHVWFDFEQTQRALIRQTPRGYSLYVQEFHPEDLHWYAVSGVSFHPSLDQLRKVLFEDFQFFCGENALRDKYGRVEYKEAPDGNEISQKQNH